MPGIDVVKQDVVVCCQMKEVFTGPLATVSMGNSSGKTTAFSKGKYQPPA